MKLLAYGFLGFNLISTAATMAATDESLMYRALDREQRMAHILETQRMSSSTKPGAQLKNSNSSESGTDRTFSTALTNKNASSSSTTSGGSATNLHQTK